MHEMTASVHCLKMEHEAHSESLRRAHEGKLKEFEGKMVEYESMKSSFDALQQELAQSEGTRSALKIEFEAAKQAHELEVDALKRQFKRDTATLEETLSDLRQRLGADHSVDTASNAHLGTAGGDSLDGFVQELEQKANDQELTFAKRVRGAIAVIPRKSVALNTLSTSNTLNS